MDKVLHKRTKTFAFIADILIVTKGSREDHLKEVEDTIRHWTTREFKNGHLAKRNRIASVQILKRRNQTN